MGLGNRFGDFDPSAYEAKAADRWGHSGAYQESALRTSQYTKKDWEAVSSEADGITEAFLALIASGTAAQSSEAMDIAERHRHHITRWFYNCTPAIHSGLGEMYMQDARFTGNIDSAGTGLASYMSNAILANALPQLD